MIAPAQRRVLFAMIESNRAAQKLIAVWPNVDVSDKRESVLIRRWAALAGLRPREVRGLWPMLVGNGFVKLDGTVDEDADRFVSTLLVARAPVALRRRAAEKKSTEPLKPEERREAF